MPQQYGGNAIQNQKELLPLQQGAERARPLAVGPSRALTSTERGARLKASLNRMGHEVREEELSISSSPPNGREESVR